MFVIIIAVAAAASASSLLPLMDPQNTTSCSIRPHSLSLQDECQRVLRFHRVSQKASSAFTREKCFTGEKFVVELRNKLGYKLGYVYFVYKILVFLVGESCTEINTKF